MPEPAATRRVFHGRHVDVEEEDWPGLGTWEVVRPRDAAAVLPLTPEGDALLVRQFRPPARTELLEIPAGLLDVEGESAEGCAIRELHEETGFRAESIELLTRYFASPGHSTERVSVFLARTASEPDGEMEPGIELVRRPLVELVVQARAGRLEDPKTALAVLLAAARPAAG
jgi:ADP-ribose pyrophosphatase